MQINDIFSPNVSLTDLSNHAPDVWREVFDEIKAATLEDQGVRLGIMRQRASAELRRWQGASTSPLAETSVAQTAVLRSKMMLLGIDQFAQAFTAQAGITPKLRDKLFVSKFFLPQLLRKDAVSMEFFDRWWSYVKDKSWAAAQIQQAGLWSVPTLEFCKHVAHLADGKPILEIAAGLGLLTSTLRSLGQTVFAVDDFSWEKTKQKYVKTEIVNMAAEESLKIRKPSFVICSWPPPGNQFESAVFNQPSVQTYVVILSKFKFASGNWHTYQISNNKFRCTQSEPVNNLLRPLEQNQQVYIFRRK